MGERSAISRSSRPLLTVSLLILSAMIPMLFIAVETTSGAFLYVGSGSTYGSIQEAVDDASPGDSIIIGKGTYTESITVTTNGLSLLGNTTSETIIGPTPGDPAINVTAKDVIVSGLTFHIGGLFLNGSNIRVSNAVFNRTSQTGIVAHSCSNLSLLNISLLSPINGGLFAANSTNINITRLTSMNSSGDVIRISDSSYVNIIDTDLDLNSSSTGMVFRNVTAVKLISVTFSSSGSGNTGAYLEDCLDITIDRCILMVDTIGLTLRNCRQTILSSSMMGAIFDGSTGMEMVSCTNTSISMLTFDVIGGKIGSSMVSCTNVFMENTSFQLNSIDPIGVLFDRSSGLMVKDSNGIVQDGPATFLQAIDSTDIGVVASLFTLAADESRLIDALSCSGLSIERNSLSSIADLTTLIRVHGGTDNTTLSHNIFHLSGGDSRAVHATGAGDLAIDNNTVLISGDISYGYLIEDVHDAELVDDHHEISATGDVGVQISGRGFNVENITLLVDGPSSTGIFLMECHNGTLQNITISVSGELSTGMVMSSMGSDIILNDITMNLTSINGMAMVIQNEGGHVDMSSVKVNSSVGAWFSMTLRGGSFRMTDLQLDSLGQGLLMENSHSSLISRSRIYASSKGVTFSGCTLDISGSEFSSMELLDLSHIVSCDSTIHQLFGISGGSRLDIYNTIGIRTIRGNLEPFQGVDLMVENWGTPAYRTSFFDPAGTDEKTDADGAIRDLVLLDSIYRDTIVNPETGVTNVTVHAEGTSPVDWDGIFTIDTSYTHTEELISPDIDLPATPTNFSVRRAETRESLFLKWDPNTDDAIEYIIYYLDPDMDDQGVAARIPSTTVTWMSPELGPSKRMFYWLTAWDGTWESPPTAVVQEVTIDRTPPAQPQLLSYVSSTKDSITMSWTHPGDDDLEGFMIFMSGPGSMDFELISTVGPDVRSYTAGGLQFSSSYRFQVQAYDGSDNLSPFSRILQASTELPMMEVRVTVHYNETGPMAGLPAANCALELLSFNGTVLLVMKTNETGIGSFIGRDPYESYMIRSSPPENLLGEVDTRSGYLPATSDVLILDPEVEIIDIELTMEYYQKMVNGSIRLRVIYGDGPRTGVVFGALVKLEYDYGIIMTQKNTSGDGTAMFVLSNLPLRGRFQVVPPEGVGGDPSLKISGYLALTTNFFELTLDDRDQDIGDVILSYYTYVPEPEDLLITAMNPYGSAVDLKTPVVIKFNQPVVTASVEEALLIAPSLKNPHMIWSDNNRSLRIEHDGFLARTEYTVIVGPGAISVDGTSFPAGYTNNTWSFTTTAIPDPGEQNDNSKYILYAIAIGAIILVIILLVYSRLSSRKGEEEVEPYHSYDSTDEYDDEETFEEDYSDDEEDQDDDDLPYDDEEYEEEEPYEEEEGQEDEFDEDMDEMEEEELEELDDVALDEGMTEDDMEMEEEPEPAPEMKSKKKKKRSR
ncbi:MAG: fibronectin type III domain-containing protein [Candidatus Thermoplasmatota archaeon]|nr:fibronectin type III domain-containing protein [Candidatus Thermoplasmatota archaeon]